MCTPFVPLYLQVKPHFQQVLTIPEEQLGEILHLFLSFFMNLNGR